MASNNGDSSNIHLPASGVPSSSTFSFKAPFPVPVAPSAAVTALKQRRVSLASPSSPRLVKPWSFRDEMGLDAHSADAESASTSETGRIIPEKKGKMRKIDTSRNSDESSVPEKKPRKKWSQEETQMLVEGCQIHGVGNWKTILQDPNLHFHDRTAVDLKDRFRTYFPDAYKKHYPNAKTHLSSKIRSTFADGTSLFEKTRSKRRRPFTEAEDRALKAGYEKHGTTWATIVKDPIFQEQNRRSTDLRDRFRNAFPHLYQAAGYKPRTATKKKVDGPVRAADDQLSMSSTGPVRSRRRAQTSLRGGVKSVPQSAVCSEDEDSSAGEEDEETSVFKKPKMPILVDNISTSPLKKSSPPNSSLAAMSNGSSAAGTFTTPRDSYMDADDEMELITIETDPLNIPDFMPNDSHSDMETWSSGINTPTHSSTAAWSTAGASPTSSHFSDFLLTGSSAAASNNPSNASSPFMQRRNDVSANNFIGKSAWGAQDWFSANPRLDASSASSSSSFVDANFSPASPFSLGQHFSHGVLDRYDLFPPSMPNDIMSDAGVGDSHNSFTEGSGGAGSSGASAGGTGFRGYHSQIAGDLISGASARPSFSSSLSLSLAGLYGQHFGGAFGSVAGEIGLGLEGIPEDAGIHPMQLHTHNSTLLGIEELGLTGISLNDHVDSAEPNAASSADDAMDGSSTNNVPDMSSFSIHSPDKRRDQQQQTEENEREKLASSILNDPFNLEDLVDMSHEAHATPPATPLMTQPRPMRRSSGGTLLNNFGDSGAASGHARSISVPPSEARNSGPSMGGAMAMDDVSLHMQSSHNVMNFGKSLQSIFNPPPQPSTPSRPQHRPRNSEPMRLSNSTGSMSPPALPHHQSDPTIFPAHLLLSSNPAAALAPSGHPQHVQDPWRLSNTSWMNLNTISPSDLYNVPYLDLHYSLTYGHPGLNGLNVTLDDHSEARQGQALDLAQSAVLASSGMAGSNKAFEYPTTVRPQQLTSKPTSSSPDAFPPPAAASAVLAAVSNESANAHNGGAGTIRQSHIKAASTSSGANLGRSMSHHRGQSAVNPQDLMLRNENKRKRASWDGGVV